MQAPELGGIMVERSYYSGREHPGVMTAAKSWGEGSRKWRAARDRLAGCGTLYRLK